MGLKRPRREAASTAVICLHGMDRDSFLCFLPYKKQRYICVVSDFRHDVGEICPLMRYYVASTGNSVPTFRDNLSVLSSSVKKPKTSRLLMMGSKRRYRTTTPRCVISQKSADVKVTFLDWASILSCDIQRGCLIVSVNRYTVVSMFTAG